MARNRSEKLTPEQTYMVALLDALRTLVRVNLEAGADKDFNNYLLGRDEQRAAGDAFNRAVTQWDPWGHVAVRPGSGWPGVLQAVEAYAKEELDGT